jgi:hypothetical protein
MVPEGLLKVVSFVELIKCAVVLIYPGHLRRIDAGTWSVFVNADRDQLPRDEAMCARGGGVRGYR